MEAVQLVCFKCKHFRRFEGGCDAFPDGIPDEITSGENKHLKPLPNQDNKIVFELDEDMDLVQIDES
jgi:hypothetical protein